MDTKKLTSVGIELGSIALSTYGFANAAYWYWVFMHSAPVETVSSGVVVLQGFPVSNIVQSLFSIALGGFIHSTHRVWPEILALFERVGRKVESEAKGV